MKKTIALLITLVMALSFAFTAMAAEESISREEVRVPDGYSKVKIFDGSYGFGDAQVTAAVNDDGSAFYLLFFTFGSDQVVEGTVEDGNVTVTFDRFGFMTKDAPQIYKDAIASEEPWMELTGEGFDLDAAGLREAIMPNMEDVFGSTPGNDAEYDFSLIEPMGNSPMKDKTIFILGSSVALGAFSEQYAVGEYLAARLESDLVKEAVGATKMVDTEDSSYVARMMKNLDPEAECDLFICQLSTNDADPEVALGEISDSTNMEDFDTTTVTGAIEYIIAYAQNTWNCPVVFFTECRYNSDLYDGMVQRLKELGEKWEIGILDLWDNEEFNAISDEERELYMSDNIHPTKAGYRDWWGPELEKQLLDYIAE